MFVGRLPQYARHSSAVSIEAGGTLDVETDGRGDLLSGQIEVMSDLDSRSQLEGAEAFEVLGRYVSVPAATSEPQHQVFVSVNAQEDTGVAVTNPTQTSP